MKPEEPANRYRTLTDAELVERSGRGESAAYDELVRRFRPGVLLITRRFLHCDGLAEDTTQEVMVRAFAALPLLRDPARFGPWLHAIARHAALRAATSERRAEPADTETIARELGEQGQSPHPAAAFIQAEKRDSIRRLVTALPPDLSEPMLLHYWEQWPLERIAGFLGVPVSTVKWRMYQGRKRIEPRLAVLLEEN